MSSAYGLIMGSKEAVKNGLLRLLLGEFCMGNKLKGSLGLQLLCRGELQS
ncbi:hypothetical protein JCM14467A_22000 [Vulcanisaeta sp. JCM 14467]